MKKFKIVAIIVGVLAVISAFALTNFNLDDEDEVFGRL